MISIRLLIKYNYLTIDAYKDKEKYRERKEIGMVFWRGGVLGHRIHGRPHPQPLSEWGGEWYVRLPLLACLCGAWGGFSLTLVSFFSHRAHRVHGAFCARFRNHRTPPAYRVHRALLLKMAVRFCDICRPQGLCGMLCVLFFCVNL